MADSDSDFDTTDRYSANLEGMQDTFHENDILNDDTNILTINEDSQSISVIDDNETIDGTRLIEDGRPNEEEDIEVCFYHHVSANLHHRRGEQRMNYDTVNI